MAQCAVPSVPSNAYETLTNRPTCDRQFQGEKRRRGSDREKEVRPSPLSYATPNSKTSDLKTAELLTSYCLLPYFFSEKLSASPTKKSIVGMHSTADLLCIQCYINYIALNAPNQNNPPEHPFVGPNCQTQFIYHLSTLHCSRQSSRCVPVCQISDLYKLALPQCARIDNRNENTSKKSAFGRTDE